MIRIALLSRWHVHAGDYAQQAQDHPDLSIEMVWDEDPARGKAWAGELGVRFEADLNHVLTDPNIDAVIVDTPTNMHKDVIVQAAASGKHIFTEKVLGLTVEDCETIFRTVEASGVQLMLSLPRLTENYYLYAQDIVDRNMLGQLSMIRCRVAHNGAVPSNEHPGGWLPERFFDKETCGGGALIDLGAHPIYLTNRLAGLPKAVTARLSSVFASEVDDNAMVLLDYQSGTLGTIETSFISNGSPFQLELYGTGGTLLIEDDNVRLKSDYMETDDWYTPDHLPESLPMPMEQWVRAIKRGSAPSITKDDMYQLTVMNQAAARSHQMGKQIFIEDMK
ncbi:Gfo/Idh/MocA family protein [Tuberibacillus sp. Marseille-P3662]|uniref:Gfo/Idh/MocA family protein n=1 Tax=Tuberibacillus sp. Marseille-P3662 TaxID=1965358 RepID=UPI000A1CA143|nr:Gfo/Idh/MocA family oxidoreductase [Tuberibacillus sp. Marseille-P3662]